MTKTAKVFWSGRSQAVRLPKEFRVDAKEVQIRKQGNTIILNPIPDSWDWLDEIAGSLADDPDFMTAINEELETPPLNPAVKKLFRR
ncbi:MAG: AbrB/MazE/SpoVT family DNA-binding domain-containing protein [Acidobacteria bacterium]|nr:MAG: AbrB/MazE/SpoVT family DNA-binding domain-containing protein [Acidobacteriota bacterium]